MTMHVCMECVGAPRTLHVGMNAMHVTSKLHSFTYLQLCMNEHVHDMNHNEKSLKPERHWNPLLEIHCSFIHICTHA